MLLLIGGKAGSGKSTVAKIITRDINLHMKNKASMTISNSEAVKDIARKQFYWNENKDELGRNLLQNITRTGYEYDMWFWERLTYNKYRDFMILPNILVVLDDFRYKITFEYFNKAFNSNKNGKPITEIVTLHVYNPRVANNDLDPSENLEFNYDYEIINNGTIKDLENEVNIFLRGIGYDY